MWTCRDETVRNAHLDILANRIRLSSKRLMMHNTGDTSMVVSTGYEDCHHFDKLMGLGHIADLVRCLPRACTLAFTSYPRSTPVESPPLSFETACYHAASLQIECSRSHETCEFYHCSCWSLPRSTNSPPIHQLTSLLTSHASIIEHRRTHGQAYDIYHAKPPDTMFETPRQKLAFLETQTTTSTPIAF